MARIESWMRRMALAFALGICLLSRASSAAALPVTVTINQIVLEDIDHEQDPSATLYRYFVSSAYLGNPLSVTNVPHVGVCALASPADGAAGCYNRITPAPGAWSFTRDVDPALGTVDVLIQIRNENALKPYPLDLSPGPLAPAEWGLGLTINLADGTWRLRNDPFTVSPTTSSSDFLGPGAIDANRLTGHVDFSVSFCNGGAVCASSGELACAGEACTTDASAGPICGGIAGTVTCSGGYACKAIPLPNPEEQNGADDDCDGSIDECNASQIGETFDCTTAVGSCPSLPGVRTCTAADQPPGACVPLVGSDPNVCQLECPGEISVSTEPELRDAIAQAHLTPCKDVIVLDPGFYDVTSELFIDDSMEIRGIGSHSDCEGVDLDEKLSALDQLDVNIGSLRCDGDDGEDPAATVIRNLAQPASPSEESMHRVLNIGTSTSRPEVTLRHLTISGGIGQQPANPGSGILAHEGSRLKLFNVVVEDNVARGPGAGIVHGGSSLDYPYLPTFVMVNSTVRRNRSTTPPLGAGIGLQGNGGGLRVAGVAFVLRSTINDNAGIRGAGILASGAIHIYNSTITRNIAGQGGAGVLATGLNGAPGLLELHNNTITNNFAQWFSAQPTIRKDGAGVLAIGDVRVEAFGNVIADNVECRDFVLNGPNGNNCSAEEGAELFSLGGNLGSADCGFSPVVDLPGLGPVASDTVVNLGYARDPNDPTLRRLIDPFRDAVEVACQIGADLGGSPDSAPLGAAQLQMRSALPSSDREVYDFSMATHLRLLGDLADQGGPTQTMALAEGSLALAATTSFEHPGYVGDGFPSAPPLCPSADQRGFVVAGGNVPLTCDAGSFQSSATAMLFVDDEADELAQLFPDSDGDGIIDSLDDSPLGASTGFSDINSGGVTSGAIQSFGDQLLRVFDAFPNPSQGVLLLTLSNGGSAPAIVTACNGTIELALEAGERRVITCPQQVPACVLARGQLQVGDRVLLNVAGVYGGSVALGTANVSSSVVSTSDIGISGGSVAGDVRAAGTVTLSAGASAGGAVENNAYVLPRGIGLQIVQPGTTDVALTNDEVGSLSPGAYRSLTLGDRARVTLGAGSYSFESLVVQNDAILVLEGSVQAKIQSQLQIGDRVRLVGTDGAPALGHSLWYTNAAEVSLGHDALWSGSIVAPAARLRLLDRASVDGCLAAEDVLLSNDTSVTSAGVLPPTNGGAGAPSCSDGILNQHETDVDCGGECGGCQGEQECTVDSDCAGAAACIAGVCTATGGSCSVASATELGVPGQETLLSNAGCARVSSGYPSWWGVRTMKLETTAAGSYPVPFTWSNACGGGGSGLFTGDWQSQLLPNVDASCPTLLELQGDASGTVTLRYWAQ